MARVKARIETVEVLSFKLKLPKEALLELPRRAAPELSVSVEDDDGELLVSADAADSYLRFRPVGDEVVLLEIFICNDDRGKFFERALGELMVRHGGELDALLTWNDVDRNAREELTKVRIAHGRTSYPSLVNVVSALQASAGGEQLAVDEPAPPPQQDPEIRELLEKARAHWEEYQRLKKQSKG